MQSPSGKLGTYRGVFRPTFLTIVGLILYLREGWVIGNAGLLGGLGIIQLCFLITGATAWSFSAITTNIRIGAGGPFSLVAQSLGLEAGGAIGVPLYLAQAMSIGFYMRGVSEGWFYLFPEHSRVLVVTIVFITGFLLSAVNDSLVVKSQFIVMLVVGVALVSMWGGLWNHEIVMPTLIGDFKTANFWQLFAVFFPAGTGIMVGASLSGKLKNPRRSIPRGILSAWAAAIFVYIISAFFFSLLASPEDLYGNALIAAERGLWREGVLIGLVASCISAMTGSILAAPSVLVALAEQGLVPLSAQLRAVSKSGTPRIATLVTSLIVGFELIFGDLDKIAGWITVLYLLTYATINIVVLVEKSLNMVSFRPSLKVPIVVPVIGAVFSAAVMVQTEPMLGMAALASVVGLYTFYALRKVDTPWETVRSGLVVAIAHKAAELVQGMEGPQYRAWKPDLLVPIDSAAQLRGEHRLLEALARQRGSVQIVAMDSAEGDRRSLRVREAVQELRNSEIIATHSEIESTDIVTAVRTATAVLRGSIVRPNILFINALGRTDEELKTLTEIAETRKMGLAIFILHRSAGLGRESSISVWLRYQAEGWPVAIDHCNIDLLLLLGYQLQRNWRARLTLNTICPDDSEESGEIFLRRTIEEARLPKDTVSRSVTGFFDDELQNAPDADLHLFGISEGPPHYERMRQTVEKLGSSALFVRDSGLESVFA